MIVEGCHHPASTCCAVLRVYLPCRFGSDSEDRKNAGHDDDDSDSDTSIGNPGSLFIYTLIAPLPIRQHPCMLFHSCRQRVLVLHAMQHALCPACMQVIRRVPGRIPASCCLSGSFPYLMPHRHDARGPARVPGKQPPGAQPAYVHQPALPIRPQSSAGTSPATTVTAWSINMLLWSMHYCQHVRSACALTCQLSLVTSRIAT